MHKWRVVSDKPSWLTETKIAVHGNFPLSYEDKNQESVTYFQMQIKNNMEPFVCLIYAMLK